MVEAVDPVAWVVTPSLSVFFGSSHCTYQVVSMNNLTPQKLLEYLKINGTFDRLRKEISDELENSVSVVHCI